MNTLAENIKRYRLLNELSQEQLAYKVGYKDRASVRHIESGRSDISTAQLVKLAEALHCTPADLLGTESDIAEFQIIGKVACGYGMLAVEDYSGGKIQIPQDWLHNIDKSEFFALQLKGDSMSPLYQNGDVAIMRKSSVLPASRIALVLLEDEEATLKEVRQGRGCIDLIPYNPDYQPRRVPADKCKILAYVYTLIRQGF